MIWCLFFSNFLKGVQVNAVCLCSNCQLGKLVDAIRHDKWYNGHMSAGERHGQCRFATTRRLSGIFKDLANSKGPTQSLIQPDLADVHSRLFRAQEDRYITEDGPDEVYSPSDRFAALEELANVLLRDYVDVGCYPQTNRFRKYMQSPSLTKISKALFKRTTASSHPTTQKAARALVVAYTSVCNENLQDIHDIGIFDNLYRVKKPNYARVIKTLYWLSIQQSAVWNVFIHLVERGFLSIDALNERMAFRQRSKEVTAIVKLLYSFELASTNYKAEIFLDDCIWATALEWLAVAIVRSCIKPLEIFEAIAYIGFLESLHVDQFKTNWDRTGCPHNRETMVGTEPPCFGFWLPHGLGSDKRARKAKVREILKKPKEVNRVFREYFQVR